VDRGRRLGRNAVEIAVYASGDSNALLVDDTALLVQDRASRRHARRCSGMR
jgi:hypothetical protein